MLRFAPSPTGDMHITDLRLALFNYMVAKQRDEDFMIRIEDTNKEHNVEGKDTEILDILGLFGIEYSHVLHQSEQLRYHRMMAIQMLGDKKAFNCFCTPELLKQKSDAAQKASRPFVYDNTCAHLGPEQIIDNENPFTIRIHRPESDIVINDLVKGEVTFTPDDVDAFMIMSAEKRPTHNFSSAVDDMISDISLIIRDEAHMGDTPKQIAVRNALGYEKTIEYAHLPTILNAEDASSSIKWLLEEGFLPSAIVNYLISLSNTTPEEIFTLEEALKWFDLSSITTVPTRFDLDKLKSINGQHLCNLDDKELSRYVGFADVAIGKVAKIYLEEVYTLKELRPKIEAIFAPKVIPEKYTQQTETMRKVIINAPYMETYEKFESYLIKESALEGENFSTPLRLLLTGTENGPEVADLYVYLKDFLGEIVK